MKFRVPQWLQVILAMIIVPPFALLSGVLVGVLLWFVLADAGLPLWARLVISILAVPGLPGLWFVALPILFWRNRVTSVELPGEVQSWQAAQFEVMERHQDAFAALRRQSIERVVAGGTSIAAGGIEMTVVAVELGASGGVITVVQRLLDDTPLEPPAPDEMPVAMPSIGAITRLTDDAGTDYIVLAQVGEYVADGGRTRIDFVPPPPPNARELRLTMRELYVRDGLVVSGPWEFNLRLT